MIGGSDRVEAIILVGALAFTLGGICGVVLGIAIAGTGKDKSE